jgi:plasmid stability protein
MAQVVIRNIDERVIERLKGRTAAQQKSLEQSLREILTEAAKPNPGELLAVAARIRAMSPTLPEGTHYLSAEELIREDRDRR